jgi:hypothetical protein
MLQLKFCVSGKTAEKPWNITWTIMAKNLIYCFLSTGKTLYTHIKKDIMFVLGVH